jgi:hypothetical protein
MPTDDPSILDKYRLIRRIHPSWIVYDDNLKIRRPSSQAFCNSTGDEAMSVFLEDVFLESGRGLEHLLAGWPEFALAAITVGCTRTCDQGVVRDPLPDEPSHALVVGRKTTNTRKRIAQCFDAWLGAPGPLA